MNNLRVLIVEDQQAEAETLQESLLQYGHQVIAVAQNLHDAIDLFSTQPPDICIIDIYLNGKPDGIVFAIEINKDRRTKRPFLFLTSAADISTFQLAKLTAPYSYLLKPFNKLELQYTIELAIEKFAVDCTGKPISEANLLFLEDVFFVKKGNMLIKFQISKIKYIEVEGKYCKIITTDDKFLVQQPLKEVHVKLPQDHFFRIHRNYIANIKEIIKIDLQNDEIFFKDGTSLFFSRRYLDDFLRFVNVLK